MLDADIEKIDNFGYFVTSSCVLIDFSLKVKERSNDMERNDVNIFHAWKLLVYKLRYVIEYL